MLQCVRENGDETGIVRRLRSQIGGVLLAGEERGLIWPRTAIRLNPSPTCAVQRASPYAYLLGTEGGVRHFQHDAAHVRGREEIVTGELQVVQGAIYVEKKGIAAPAHEQPVFAGIRHMCLLTGRDRRALHDDLPIVAGPSCL